jgi:Subtilase family/PKD-like domain/Secretion system C-terminal sorting domain/Ig-like domain CHU_C associated
MHKAFAKLLVLLLSLFMNGWVVAQVRADYTVKLQSGDFTPPANFTTLESSDSIFTRSRFAGVYYLILQFNEIPTAKAREVLKSEGVELIDYITGNAYTAKIAATINWQRFKTYNIRSVFQLTDLQKTIPDLFYAKVPSHAQVQAGYADVTVISYEKLILLDIENSIKSLGGEVLEELPQYRSFIIRVPLHKLKEVIRLSFVQWAEFIDVPNRIENLPGRTLHRVNVIGDGPRNLKGDGINVGIWDGGAIGPHTDFFPTGRVTQVQNVAQSDHSTHCAGTILGRGLINPIARGMAPNAKLYSYDFNGNVPSEIAAAIPQYNLSVSSHSYGGTATCGVTGASIAYSSTSRSTDLNLNSFPYHLHVHSAGNSQTSCSGGWYTITGSGKSAKNNILVAALTSTDAMTSFSSFGPVADGRVKPDISSMGNNVYSTTIPGNSYTTMSGTSMATPGVAGSVALLVQRYKELNSNANPPSALIKNSVLNTALDLGNTGPDYKFGYGRIDVLEAVRVLEQNRYVVNTVAHAASNEFTINVPAGAVRLNVMLVWNDPAGTANASTALVNNLDLTLVNGANNYLPWVLDKNNPAAAATRGVDNVSNVEQVTIYAPAAGVYTIKVMGASVSTGASQEYSVTWNIDQPRVEMIYPNGGESFSPGSSEIITWNAVGTTGTHTLEYSVDNGANWLPIASSLGNSTTRYTWTVPSGVNTSQALVRVTNGTYIDQSDAVFNILGIPTSFTANGVSCNAGEVNFSWNAVSGATNYSIFQLDPTSGDFISLASGITSTSYTATGLTAGTSMWFFIRALNATNGAVGNRTNAVNVTVSSGGGSMGALGNVAGQTTICGATNQLTYSIPDVSGATSYVWSVPSGAAIVSGQGTTTINVQYGTGSSSGNVTVYATNGACQTATSTLAITIGSTSIAAPVSGGNQTQNVCLGATIPTLRATATVSAGFSVVWYSAATAGSLVANPTLNAIGAVTYYAAAKDNSTGCESVDRTAVTLTLVAIPAASITANGPLVFCQGNSVVLTASPSGIYQWSNGATTAAITVSSSGTFTVSVASGGCVTTSAPVAVTVNPVPAAVITPLTATTVCDGDNVLLSASAGNLWVWSNGATSQSALVNTAGSYSVTVTNSFGCSAISSPIQVTVVPNPVATITANPYTSIYPGLTTSISSSVSPSGSYSYAWYLNNTILPGETSSSLDSIGIKHPSGNYTLRVQNNPPSLSCANISTPLVIGDSATTRLFIFPSPNNGKFKVSYYSATSAKYSIGIYDSRGALVLQKEFAINSRYQMMDVDLSNVANGIYIVRLLEGASKVLAIGKVAIIH